MYGFEGHSTPVGTNMKAFVYDVWTNSSASPWPQLRYSAPLPANCEKANVDASGRILCTKCKTGFFNNDYKCVQGCPSGMETVDVLTTLIGGLVEGPYCRPCPAGCKSCFSTNCTSCLDGFTQNQTATGLVCNPSCLSNQFFNQVCTNCSSNCLSCVN